MKKIIMIIILMTLMIVACDDSNKQGTTTNPFVGGTESLTFSFLQGEPPQEIYGDETFSISIELNNVGEYDVSKEDVRLKLTGIEPRAFSKQSSDFIKNIGMNLKGKYKDPSTNSLEPGDNTIVSFEGLSYIDFITGVYNPTVKIEACYNYGTKIISSLCIKENNEGRDSPNNLCSSRSVRTFFASSGPIQISSLEQRPKSADEIIFQFTIKHNGAGLVYENSSDCKTDLRSDVKDKIYVKVNTGFNSGLYCEGLNGGEGIIKLYNNEKLVRCTQKISEEELGEYIKPINIELNYGYEKILDKTLTIYQ